MSKGHHVLVQLDPQPRIGHHGGLGALNWAPAAGLGALAGAGRADGGVQGGDACSISRAVGLCRQAPPACAGQPGTTPPLQARRRQRRNILSCLRSARYTATSRRPRCKRLWCRAARCWSCCAPTSRARCRSYTAQRCLASSARCSPSGARDPVPPRRSGHSVGPGGGRGRAVGGG